MEYVGPDLHVYVRLTRSEDHSRLDGWVVPARPLPVLLRAEGGTDPQRAPRSTSSAASSSPAPAPASPGSPSSRCPAAPHAPASPRRSGSEVTMKPDEPPPCGRAGHQFRQSALSAQREPFPPPGHVLEAVDGRGARPRHAPWRSRACGHARRPTSDLGCWSRGPARPSATMRCCRRWPPSWAGRPPCSQDREGRVADPSLRRRPARPQRPRPAGHHRARRLGAAAARARDVRPRGDAPRRPRPHRAAALGRPACPTTSPRRTTSPRPTTSPAAPATPPRTRCPPTARPARAVASRSRTPDRRPTAARTRSSSAAARSSPPWTPGAASTPGSWPPS